ATGTAASAPGAASSAATVAAKASADGATRSQATTRTTAPAGGGRRAAAPPSPGPGHGAVSAVTRPPSGPSPGARSGTTSSPAARRARASPPTATTRAAPAAASARATRAASGRPSRRISALSAPIRRLAPPQSTAPSTGGRGGPGPTGSPHAAVAGLDAPARPVVGDGVGQVGQEGVGRRQVGGRDDGVEPALLAVEVPAAVVHDVADRAHVDAGARVGGDLHDPGHRVAGDVEAVDGLDAGPEPRPGGPDLVGEPQVALHPQVPHRRPGGRDQGGGARAGGRGRAVQAAGPAVEEEVLALQQVLVAVQQQRGALERPAVL